MSNWVVEGQKRMSRKEKQKHHGFEKYERKRSSLSSYERKSQGATMQEKLKPADPNQYCRYLKNAENIFYEDSADMKLLTHMKKYRPLLFKSLAVLLLTYYLVSLVKGYEGTCPQNAECGVFVHCHTGYELVDDACQISEDTKNAIKYICQAAVTNLQLKYGNSQCETGSSVQPVQSLHSIIQEFQVESEAGRDELYAWFSDYTNQQQYSFKNKYNGIVPTKAKYSLSCRASLLVQTATFKYILVASLISCTVIFFLLKRMYIKMRAGSIYSKLKQKIANAPYQQMRINYVEMRKHYGEITKTVWIEVDRARSKDGKIVYYEDDDYVYWKVI